MVWGSFLCSVMMKYGWWWWTFYFLSTILQMELIDNKLSGKTQRRELSCTFNVITTSCVMSLACVSQMRWWWESVCWVEVERQTFEKPIMNFFDLKSCTSFLSFSSFFSFSFCISQVQSGIWSFLFPHKIHNYLFTSQTWDCSTSLHFLQSIRQDHFPFQCRRLFQNQNRWL